ncbi:Hypothetical protein DEACI_3828 [Acididesulfobacillus acetoxydans]|uniref:Uncharacterized protein n=1 Tax=Acididesulfobacillus acetoxydans TaxID=1561005 RepID=A0A8S0Y4J0_9FIRM|nr:Hypothetical protein DEACI_3828 [Acididesulfobacillus acetoxydans]CEJ05887.1 Hypothetical protein DEACI_0307 [Acididesulfobacillus acetoxydans]
MGPSLVWTGYRRDLWGSKRKFGLPAQRDELRRKTVTALR